jgi:hypothetical protein
MYKHFHPNQRMAHLSIPEWFQFTETIVSTKVRTYIGDDFVSESMIHLSTLECQYGTFNLINSGKAWKIDTLIMMQDKSKDELCQIIMAAAQEAREEENYWFAAFITRMLKNTKF